MDEILHGYRLRGARQCDTVQRMQNDALITPAQAGVILGKSSSTIRRMAESGELPYVQKLDGPNGPYLFRRAVVERAAAEQAKAAAAS